MTDRPTNDQAFAEAILASSTAAVAMTRLPEDLANQISAHKDELIPTAYISLPPNMNRAAIDNISNYLRKVLQLKEQCPKEVNVTVVGEGKGLSIVRNIPDSGGSTQDLLLQLQADVANAVKRGNQTQVRNDGAYAYYDDGPTMNHFIEHTQTLVPPDTSTSLPPPTRNCPDKNNPVCR